MSWDAMLQHESQLARRRWLSRLSKAELIDRLIIAESEVSTAPPVHENGCHPGCRHECGECRLGLGVHRTCDPRCEVAEHEIRRQP